MTTQTEHKKPRAFLAGIVAFGMLIAALSMWTLVPLLWLWIGSQLAASQFPSMGPYAVVLLGVIGSILIVGWLIGHMNDLYLTLTGSRTVAPIRLGWMKSLRDPAKSNEPPTVMETVIIGSVLLAALCLLAWFFTLAGSPITRGG